MSRILIAGGAAALVVAGLASPGQAATSTAPTLGVVASTPSGTTAPPSTRTTVTFAVTNNSPSGTTTKLEELYLVVPSGITGASIGTVTAPAGKTWKASLLSCGRTPSCSSILKIASTKDSSANWLARGETVRAAVSLVTPRSTGTVSFRIQATNPSSFRFTTPTPFITITTGTTPPVLGVGVPTPSPVLSGASRTVLVSSTPALPSTATTFTVKVNKADAGATINGTTVSAAGTATFTATPSGGAVSFAVTFSVAQAGQSLTVTSGASTGTSSTFTVASPVLTVSTPTGITARDQAPITVTNPAFTGGTVTVAFAIARDGDAVNGKGLDSVTRSVTFDTSAVAGSFSFDATFFQSGSQRITVTSGEFSGRSASFPVAKGDPYLSFGDAVALPKPPRIYALPVISVSAPFRIPFTITDLAGNPYVDAKPDLTTSDPLLASNLTVDGSSSTATDATGSGSMVVSYKQATPLAVLLGTFQTSQANAYAEVIDVGVSVIEPGVPFQPLAILNQDLGLGGATASVDLPQGAFGPVSVYVAPADCTDPTLSTALDCSTNPQALTVDLVATAPSDAPTPYQHLYTDTNPASVTITCEVSACPEPTAPAPSPNAPQPGQLSAGQDSSCAVVVDGTASCWGGNTQGQIGNGTQEPALPPVTVVPPVGGPGAALATVRSVSQGGAAGNGTDGRTTCAIVDAGSVTGQLYCWGSNASGQIPGFAGSVALAPVPITYADTAVPGTFPPLTGVRQVAVGAGHVCVVLDLGSAWCWGANLAGQSDPNDAALTVEYPRQLAPPLVDPNGFISVSAGLDFTCAAVSGVPSARAYCWGSNSSGQLGQAIDPIALSSGQGFVVDPANPGQPVTGVSLLTTGNAFGCLARGPQDLLCWGDDAHGQLGIDTVDLGAGFSSTPVASPVWGGSLSSGTPYLLDAGIAHACVVSSGIPPTYAPQLVCWGDDSSAQAGMAGTAAVQAPTAIAINGSTSQTIVDIALGGDHTCLRTDDWQVQCWGSNGWSESGVDNATNPVTAATVVAGLPTTLPPPPTTQLDEYNAYPLYVSLKSPGGFYLPYALAPTCRNMNELLQAVQTGEIVDDAAVLAGFCVDVAAIVRDPDTGRLSRPVLFVEDPKLTPLGK